MEVAAVLNVRWHDGYYETFECNEVRFGSHLLWCRLVSGQNRHIPLQSVRWFSVSPESHEDPSIVNLNSRPSVPESEFCFNQEG